MAFVGFTPRELEVIVLRVRGLTAREIASQLGYTRVGTYNHLWRVTQKTGIKDKAELARWAAEVGLDEPLEDDVDLP